MLFKFYHIYFPFNINPLLKTVKSQKRSDGLLVIDDIFLYNLRTGSILHQEWV